MISKKILAIGNSFSICAGRTLPNIVLGGGDCVKFVSACIGGCVLERHWNELQKSDADPSYKPYYGDVWYVANGKVIHDYDSVGDCDLPTLLKEESYDVITIQQGSHASWDPATYEPFAGQLIARIRKEQSRAKIMIQQTWSYRAQDGRFNAAWPFDNNGMFERLDAAYKELADRYGFQRIPTGKAVQLTRERTPEPKRFHKISAGALAEYRWPDLPPQAGDVVGAMNWSKDGEGNMVIQQDNIHLNLRGEYLQGCVWYGAIFGVDPRTIQWKSDVVSNEDAEFLHQCAYDALVHEGLLK